jgi:uncharacterized membrane protein YebE (DUF533 family)
MAALQKILGTMVARKLGARGGVAGAIGTAAMMGLGGKAGLAALGYLAYRSYRESRRSGKPLRGAVAGTVGDLVDDLTGQDKDKAQNSLGAKIRNAIDPGESEIEDRKALLLIRAMIAAAHADGKVDPEQRRRIVEKLDDAQPADADRRLIERELEKPVPLDELLREVDDDKDAARQFYIASRIAMDEPSETQTAYLEYVRRRLKLSPEDVDGVERALV